MAKKEIETNNSLLVVEAGEHTKSLFERVEDYLTEKEWHITSFPDEQYHSLNLRLKHGTVKIVVDVAEGEGWQRILVYCIYPNFVPDSRRAVVSEALTRINFSLGFGNFEMDLRDGEMRARTWLETESAMPSYLIDRAIRKSVDLADQYQAGLLAVAFGGVSPVNIVELATSAGFQTLQ